MDVADGVAATDGVSDGMGETKIIRRPSSGIGDTVFFLLVKKAKTAPNKRRKRMATMSGFLSGLSCIAFRIIVLYSFPFVNARLFKTFYYRINDYTKDE